MTNGYFSLLSASITTVDAVSGTVVKVCVFGAAGISGVLLSRLEELAMPFLKVVLEVPESSTPCDMVYG